MKVKLRKQPKIRGSFDDDEFSYDVRGLPKASHKDRLNRTPQWATNDLEVQALLKKIFPKLDTDHNQRTQAGKWTRIIYLYYRVAWQTSAIAEEIGIPEQRVQSTLYRIRCAAAGLRTDCNQRATKRGRPRRNTSEIHL